MLLPWPAMIGDGARATKLGINLHMRACAVVRALAGGRFASHGTGWHFPPLLCPALADGRSAWVLGQVFLPLMNPHHHRWRMVLFLGVEFARSVLGPRESPGPVQVVWLLGRCCWHGGTVSKIYAFSYEKRNVLVLRLF